MRQKSFPVEGLSFLFISMQVALYLLMWFRLLGDTSLKTMDFVSFYAAGRLARSGDYHQLYDFDAESVVQREVVGTDNYDPLIFNHPAHLVPLLAVIATNDYVQAYVWWTVARLVTLVICGELIRRYLLRANWDGRSAFLTAFASVCFFPIFVSLLGGQDTIFTLLGLLLWMFALLNGDEIRAGLGLALATLSPTIAGALALPMFAARRRESLWFILGVTVLAFYSFVLVGVGGIRDFLHLLQISSQGRYYGFDWKEMYNLAGLLMRNIPALSVDTARLIAWAAAFLSILGMCILWWHKQEELRIEHIGIAVVFALFTSPHLNLHALSYLLLPMLGLVALLWNSGNKTLALLFLPSISLLLIVIIFFIPAWNFAAYYLLMFALAYGLWSNLRKPLRNPDFSPQADVPLWLRVANLVGPPKDSTTERTETTEKDGL